jgi:hypothetical protein
MIKTKTKTKTKRQIAAEEKQCFWQNHIQGWRERGINQADYCREQGLKESIFTYWKGKLTQEPSAISNTSVISNTSAISAASSASSASSISLVPVGVKVNVEASPKPFAPPKPLFAPPKPLVVVVDSYFRIEVSGDFESAILGKLVSTLRQL